MKGRQRQGNRSQSHYRFKCFAFLPSLFIHPRLFEHLFVWFRQVYWARCLVDSSLLQWRLPSSKRMNQALQCLALLGITVSDNVKYHWQKRSNILKHFLRQCSIEIFQSEYNQISNIRFSANLTNTKNILKKQNICMLLSTNSLILLVVLPCFNRYIN